MHIFTTLIPPITAFFDHSGYSALATAPNAVISTSGKSKEEIIKAGDFVKVKFFLFPCIGWHLCLALRVLLI